MCFSKLKFGLKNDNQKRKMALLILRLLGAFAITVSLAYAEDACSTFEVSSVVEVKTGSDVNLRCCLQNNSSQLQIVEITHNYVVPDLIIEDANIVNVTIRQIKYEELPYEFHCRHNNDMISVINVAVGSDTRNDVEDLTCEAKDLLGMNCTVKVRRDSIYTTHSFFVNGVETTPTINWKYINLTEYYLNLTEQYKTHGGKYNFVIYSKTNFSDVPRKFTKLVDQCDIAKPRLQNVALRNITTDGAILSWNVPNYAAFRKFTNGLHFDLSLKDETLGLVNNSSPYKNDGGHFLVEFSNLFSYYKYKVQLRVKANSTSNNDRMWSEQFEETFETHSKSPKESPEINIGNFYFHPKGKNINLFWKQIPVYKQNGKDFTYTLYEIKENDKIINSSVQIYNNSALVNINWNTTSKYEFKLKSKNTMGVSEESSVLKISPRDKNIIQMQEITKVYHNQTYTVSWLKPINFTALSSFTLFWCDEYMGFQNRCKGPIDFINLDRNTFNFNHTTDKTNSNLIFALSENSNNDTYSSGMMWATCGRNVQTDHFQRVLTEVTKTTENSITFQWKTECWHKTIIKEYILEYWEDNTKNFIKKTIQKDAEEYKINKLKPSTKYKFTIKPILNTTTASELKSEPITAETTQAPLDPSQTIFIASTSIIVGVAFILLVYSLKKKISQMMNIRMISPIINEDHKGGNGVYNMYSSRDYGDTSFSLTPSQPEYFDILQPASISYTSFNDEQHLNSIFTPTVVDQTKIDQAKERLMATEGSVYVNDMGHSHYTII